MNNDYLAGPLSVIASSFGINPSSDTAQDTSQLAAAPSGSRALSNHLLWRSAFRHDNFLGPTNNISTPPPTITNNGKETIIEIEDDASSEQYDGDQFHFQYPFNDLLIWAVLTKRHEMALCMFWILNVEILITVLFLRYVGTWRRSNGKSFGCMSLV